MTQRLSTFKWAFGPKRQTAYATPLADGDLTKSHPLVGLADVEEVPEVLTDADEAGRGTEWSGQQSIERWDATLQRQTWGTPEILGWLGAFWFGSVITTQPDVGQAPLVYEHDFRVLRPPTTELPVTTIVELNAESLRRKVESVVVQALELSFDNPGRLKVAADLVGSGKVTLPGSFTFPALPAESQVFFRTNLLVVTLGGATVSARVLSGKVKLDNALLLAQGYEPGSGLYRARIEYGPRRPITFELVLQLDATGAELATLRAGTVLTPNSLVFDGTTSTNGVLNHKCTISIPRLSLTKAVIGDKDGRRIITLTAEVLDDQVATSPVRLIVRNATPAYLTT